MSLQLHCLPFHSLFTLLTRFTSCCYVKLLHVYTKYANCKLQVHPTRKCGCQASYIALITWVGMACFIMMVLYISNYWFQVITTTPSEAVLHYILSPLSSMPLTGVVHDEWTWMRAGQGGQAVGLKYLGELQLKHTMCWPSHSCGRLAGRWMEEKRPSNYASYHYQLFSSLFALLTRLSIGIWSFHICALIMLRTYNQLQLAKAVKVDISPTWSMKTTEQFHVMYQVS